MKKSLLALLISASLFGNVAMAAQTIKANVNGMVCAFCAQGIEKKMRALSQTKDVYVNLKQRIVAVEVKDGQTMSDETVKDIISKAGYSVTSITKSDQSASAVKAELEAKQEAK
jgi:cation transport ATPase